MAANDKKLIFYSDQNDDHRVSTTAMLEDLGFSVQAFVNGEDAMAAAATARPDVFITSMGLKGDMDGLQFVRALKKDANFKDVAVILHTGATQVMHLPFSFAPDPVWFPVDAVVEKPARKEFFKKTIDSVLEAKASAVA